MFSFAALLHGPGGWRGGLGVLDRGIGVWVEGRRVGSAETQQILMLT